jgi:tRNA (cmo5U34)-methyltransferase
MDSKNDDVGDNIHADNANWSFGDKVADTFDDHVKKSVPLYDEGHGLISRLSDFFLPNNSLCYELGCSTGNLTRKLAERHQNRNVKFIGLDTEDTMVNKAKEKTKDFKSASFEVADITNYELEKCDLIISYYTIQFIHPRERQDLINKIYESLNWGGAFIWFEKVRGNDARFQDIWSAIYNDYKLEQGYTPNEIIHKQRSLKGVLEPFSTQGNMGLLERAGFVDIATVMKYVPFAGFLAIK